MNSRLVGRNGIPGRYRNYFRDLRVTRADGTWSLMWECRMCGQIIQRNTAGAQSHLAKHVRQGKDAAFFVTEREDGQR